MKLDLNKFLLFGDSITEFSYNLQPYLLNPDLVGIATGFEFALGPALTNDYTRKLDVIQRGWSGYNSRLAKLILPLLLAKDHDNQPDSKKIKILYVFFGTNDATVDGDQTIEIPEYKENMSSIVEELLSRNIKVILVSPTYHNAQVWEGFAKYTSESGRRTTERNVEYRDALKSVAQSYNVAFLDLYKEFTNHAASLGVKPEELLVDGVHFNGKGYEAFYNGISKTISDTYPEFIPDNLEANLVPWRDAINDEFYKKLASDC